MNREAAPAPSLLGVDQRPAAPRLLEALIVGIVVVADQIAKNLVRRALDLHESVNVIPGVLDLTHVRNTGAAFGFLNAVDFPFKPAVITTVAGLALVAIALFAARLQRTDRLARVGLSLILGGAIGNLFDRATVSYVVDFVDVYWRDYHFWAFNVADAAITVGAGVVILDMLRAGPHVPKAS
jgi:signal peptidase II